MKRTTLKQELLAEFLGTFTLVTFGVAVVAQVILSEGRNGGYLSINLGWGLAVVMGVYVAGGVTGAHLNPAVTLALAARRGFAWGKLLPYWIAQVAGGFVASAVVFMTYHDALNAFDKGTRIVLGDRGTAGIFATYPQPFLSTTGGLIDQVVGTALLVLAILAVTDSRNTAPSPTLAPVVIGPAGSLNRDDVRIQLRVRDQSGARSWTPVVYLGRRMGNRGVSRCQLLVLGADCWTTAGRDSRSVCLRWLRW